MIDKQIIKLRPCPFCLENPAYGIDSFSLIPYIRCENKKCSVHPAIYDDSLYGTTEQIINELGKKWNENA